MLRKLFAVCLLAVAGQAHAVLITTSVGTYDVTTLRTSFVSSTTLLQSQVWFGNVPLAEEFASLVGDSFGFPNFIGSMLFTGPWFTTSQVGNVTNSIALFKFSELTFNVPCGSDTDTCAEAIHAVATKVVPEPGTLALFAAGLIALAFARRRRTN